MDRLKNEDIAALVLYFLETGKKPVSFGGKEVIYEEDRPAEIDGRRIHYYKGMFEFVEDTDIISKEDTRLKYNIDRRALFIGKKPFYYDKYGKMISAGDSSIQYDENEELFSIGNNAVHF